VFVAIRDLRFARGRFALMGGVIVLITMLVGLLSGLTAGLGRQNVSAITELPADEIAFAVPGRGQRLSYGDSTVTERQWKRWAEQPGVRRAEPLGITTTRASSDSSDSAGGEGREGGEGAVSAAVSVFGVTPGSALAPASASIDDRSVVVSEAAADELDLTAGDGVILAGQRLDVAAVRGQAWFSHTPVVWTSLDTWRRVAPPVAGTDRHEGPAEGATATVIALTVASDVDLVSGDEAAGTTTVSRQDSLSAIGSYASENGSLEVMRGFLFAISALVVGAFFTVWTIQRSGDVAVLKALGAATGTLLKDALGQAVVLLTTGTALGTALATAVGALLGGAPDGSGIPFSLTAATVLVPAAVVVALGLLGAGLAVRHITAVDPLTALGSSR
jgi:putative ABC transport system permease protein